MAASIFIDAKHSSMAMTEAATLMDRMYRHQRHIYDASRKFYLLGRDGMIAGLAPPDQGTILEIGCGTGRNLIKAARMFPHTRCYGLDVSEEMLVSARQSIRRAGFSSRIEVAQADATAFDPLHLFGVARFDRVFISYALSMIPPWRDVLASACSVLTENGSLHVVDFGDQAGLPSWFGAALRQWLSWFSVTPRLTLEDDMRALARTRGLGCQFSRPLRSYAFQAVLQQNTAFNRSPNSL